MKAAGQDPAEARAKVKAWERRKSDFVLNRRELDHDLEFLFSPAATIGDAKNYAGKTLGLKQTTAYSLGLNLDVANGLNQAISWINESFGSITQAGYLENVMVYTKKDAEGYAAYNHKIKVLFVNKDATRTNAISKMRKTVQANYDVGYWSSKDPLHSVYHELGHAVQHKILDNNEEIKKSVQDLYSQTYSDILGADTRYLSTNDPNILVECKKAKQAGFSYYGLKDAGEFTAESIAQFLAGDPGEIAKRVVSVLGGGR